MALSTGLLAALAVLLFLVNVYQYLVQRAALRIAEILYIMSRNVREKAAEVRRDQKDVEIIEAHLFDLTTSARSILRALGRSESALGPDPVHTMSTNGHNMTTDSLIRLADNIFYAVSEEAPEANWDEVVNKVLDRFIRKVPTMEREAARKIIAAVGQQFQRESVELQLASTTNRDNNRNS